MEGVSAVFLKMEQNIRAKLLLAGATSIAKAVTIEEADFDMQEQNWLDYVAGGMFACVNKTKNRLYYTSV
jgi:hypothetical protein